MSEIANRINQLSGPGVPLFSRSECEAIKDAIEERQRSLQSMFHMELPTMPKAVIEGQRQYAKDQLKLLKNAYRFFSAYRDESGFIVGAEYKR